MMHADTEEKMIEIESNINYEFFHSSYRLFF